VSSALIAQVKSVAVRTEVKRATRNPGDIRLEGPKMLEWPVSRYRWGSRFVKPALPPG